MLGGANTMKYFRWLLGLIALGWGLYAATPMVFTALYKFDPSKPVPAEGQRFIALMQATPWWVVGAWAAMFLLTMLAAWRLFRGGPAAMVLGLVFILVGAIVSLTVIGAIIGIPLAIIGLLLLLRGIF